MKYETYVSYASFDEGTKIDVSKDDMDVCGEQVTLSKKDLEEILGIMNKLEKENNESKVDGTKVQ